MNRFRDWLVRTMYGRYGQDAFGRFLFFLSIVLCIISIFTNYIVFIATLLVMGVEYYRMFSKNHAARRKENERYLKCTAWIRRLFKKSSAGNYDRSKYKIFKCPQCKQKLRLPRNRGKIEIRCRKCGNQFIRRT
ncbi:MAG: hypothetical protein MJ130_01175 [Lachnospiraceae bacterium]|nr:hypothetical protein [Lachnospiraceae bacterium]